MITNQYPWAVFNEDKYEDIKMTKENPYTPNPDCEKCTKDNTACISHYMLAGGYND